MSNGLVVVGSVALDSVEANGTVHDDVLGGSASFFATAASYFAPVKLVAVVGEDLPEQHLSFLAARGVDLAGLERASRQDLPLEGALLERPRQPHDARHAAQRVRRLQAAPARGLARRRARLPRQHPSDAAARRARAGQAAAPGGDGHDELLDRGQAAGAGAACSSGSTCWSSTTRRRASCRRSTTCRGRRGRFARWGPRRSSSSAASRARSCSTSTASSPRPPIRSSRWSIRPAPATRSPAASWATWRAVRDVGPQAVRRAMFYGSVMASFCVEDFSLDRLRSLSDGEIEGRYRAFRDLTHFEDVRL